ncbi:autotransporter domain-containing protein [Desulfocurvibacter africanus]|uniref:autotransporter domain-containing protein n=1 Tax=Desulfocurvibacter africanus TaxID=873 RepID=UPI000410B5CC|nr:autotransporter outer membrane beta-barrel domain-containing protein [Desulfocurvibacter africanus]
MFFLREVAGLLHKSKFSSMSRVLLLYFAVVSLGFVLMLPQYGVAATVNYAAYYRDVIGNPSFLDGPISIGGTNNLASHSENIYSYGNIVNINGGTVDFGIYGGYHNGVATSGNISSNDNAVTIGAAFAGSNSIDIYGGYARSANPWSMTASDNTVTINGGTARYVYGGFASLGGMVGPASATASGNVINLNGGSISSIMGGYATALVLPGTHTASGNAININGGTVFNEVFGGYVGAPNGFGLATNNSVTISGSPNLTAASLCGGYLSMTTSGDAFSGNTLNIKTSGLTVNNISNFQYLNFYLPSSLSAGDTVLTVTGTADLTGSSGRSSTVNVGIDGSSSPLQIGDTITLIDAGTLVTNSGLNSRASGTGMQGVTLIYNFDLTTENNKLLATVSAETAPTVNEQTKALSEGFVSGLGIVMQGADVAAGQGMDSAVSAAKAGVAGSGGAPVGFGALSGGSVRYNTGSHVDMHSASLMAGLAWGANISLGRLTFGPFFEYGNGSYNTYNSFSYAASVEGDGNTRYLGGGILGRMDLVNTGPGHIYVEASGRAGGLHNEYESSDLRDAAGRSAEYDSSSTYYGLHLGTGYVWNITENASLDLYGKYFWTRQEGDSVTLSTGDPIDFKDVDSNRLRFGSRFSYTVNEYIIPYIGAAYEHEFDGNARASTNGYDIKAPSLSGDTGTGELGLAYTPLASLPLSFDLGVQGYVGKREGVTGSLQIKYEF